MSELRILAENTDPRTTVLTLGGAFEGMSALEAKEELLKFTLTCGTRNLVLNLTEISYIDSSAISVLIEMAKAAAPKKTFLSVIGANESIKKVLFLTNIQKLMTVL